MNNFAIINARVVTPAEVIENGCVHIKGGRIESIEEKYTPERKTDCQVIDGQGMWLIPGIIDLHNDAIEKEIEPRPNALLPLEIAMFSLENRLLMHGVTSIYHSLSFIDGDSGVRNAQSILFNIEGINRLKKYGLIRHFIHARYDITEKKFCRILIDMIEKGSVQMISFMDHTPGQGQYKKLEEFEKFTAKYRSMEPELVKKLVESRIEKSKDAQILEFIDLLADKARKFKIPMASHDDDSPAKVMLMKNKGVTISEFPVDIETAEAAAKEGQYIVVGAPNIIRGFSNSGNMRAIDAIMKGCANILCSDYVPSSILHAVFILHNKYGLGINDAVNMATINSARAVGADGRLGSIECGKQADLALVREIDGIPFVEQLFVHGKRVFSMEQRGQTAANDTVTADNQHDAIHRGEFGVIRN